MVSLSDHCLTVVTVNHPPYLMVWGAFAYGGLVDFVIFPEDQTVNNKVYLKMLNNNLADCFAAVGTEILQKDGAPYTPQRSLESGTTGMKWTLFQTSQARVQIYLQLRIFRE